MTPIITVESIGGRSMYVINGNGERIMAFGSMTEAVIACLGAGMAPQIYNA